MIMGYFDIVIWVLTALLETGFLYIWLKEFVSRRKLNNGIITAVILFASIIRYCTNRVDDAMISMVLGIACSLLVSIILFKGQYGILFFYTLANQAVCVSVECLVNHFIIHVPAVLAEIALLSAILWMIKPLPIPKRDSNANLSYTWKQCMAFDLISILACGFTACLYIFEDMSDMGTDIGFVIAEIALIISVFAIVYLHGVFGSGMEKANEFENMNIYLEKLAEHYRSIEDMHEQYDVFMHDMKHQFRAISALAEEGDCKSISSIIDRMRINVGNIEQGIICSNKALNALLLERRAYAVDNGIVMEMEIIEPLYLQDIEDIDLIAIIGNLLDNAINAQKHVDKQDGILFRMRTARDGGHIIIHIENDYDKKHSIGKVVVKSVENIGNKHGIGLSSVHDTVRKYGGIIENNKSGGRYVVDVILPVREEGEGTERQTDSSSAYLHLLSK